MIAPVVDVSWLLAHRDEVMIADVRWYLDGRPGRAAYDQGHIPGAVFVDLDRWLADRPSPQAGRHPLPAPAVFADGMGQLGIGDRDTVIAYDDAGGVVAARLVWLLRATGHEAALLDGGLAAYPGGLDMVAPTPVPKPFTARPWPEDRLIDLAGVATGEHVLLDARAPDRFAGHHEPVDPRPGHIPGARSLPTREHLAADGRFLEPEVLRRRFTEAGVDDAGSVVSYCGSGINACHALLALELAGLPPGRLYPGSYSQWSHSDRPVARTP